MEWSSTYLFLFVRVCFIVVVCVFFWQSLQTFKQGSAGKALSAPLGISGASHAREEGGQKEAGLHISWGSTSHFLMFYCLIRAHLQNTNSKIKLLISPKTVITERRTSVPSEPKAMCDFTCHMSTKPTLMESEFAGDITAPWSWRVLEEPSACANSYPTYMVCFWKRTSYLSKTRKARHGRHFTNSIAFISCTYQHHIQQY